MDAEMRDIPAGGVMPIVPRSNAGNRGLLVFGVILLLGGGALFAALSANRQELAEPAISEGRGGAGQRITAAPPLNLPQPKTILSALPTPAFSDSTETRLSLPAAQPSALRQLQPQYSPPQFVPPPQVNPYPAQPAGPPVIFEAPDNPTFQQGGVQNGADPNRVYAARLANPSATVVRGTVIPAVLETALDSTRPGAVRALVQLDVRSFDGSRVLIHRGSRLYGQYQADLSSGQRRAAIQWTRLIRPDGVTIDLDSPASDPLGRAGVRGKVDSKFFQRFGGAILQSVLDIGVGIATREATDGVIVALPGSTQNVRVSEPGSIQPTLTVRQGTSVSVFVARDLDFSTVEP